MGFLVRRLDDNGSHCFSEISISISLSTSSDDKSFLSFPRDVYAPFPESNHTVVGYCQGLFCLEYDDGKIIVWNPATKEFKILPPSDMNLSIPRPHCKAHVISRVRGLGFDPASGDYKVVRFVTVFYVNSSSDDINEFDQGAGKRAEVYSLKDECWKEIDVPSRVFEENDIVDEYAICINGVCFWKGVEECDREAVFIRLSLADDRFSTKPFPRDGDGDSIHNPMRHCAVMEFDGALGLIMYDPLQSRRKVLRRYSAAVVKEDDQWIRSPKLIVRAERPLGYCTTQLLLLEDYDTKLLVYDFVTQELHKIHHIFDHPNTMQLFPYVETTISLPTLMQISPTPTPTPTPIPTLCIFDIERYMREKKIANEEKRECIRKRKEEKSANKEIRQWVTREIKKIRKREQFLLN